MKKHTNMWSPSVTDADSESDGSMYTPLSKNTSRARQRSLPGAGQPQRKLRNKKYKRKPCSISPLIRDSIYQPDDGSSVGGSVYSADDEDELLRAPVSITKPKREHGSCNRCQNVRRTGLPAVQSNKSVWFLRVEVTTASRAFSSRPVNIHQVSAADSANPKTNYSRRRNYNSAQLLEAFDAHLHRQGRDTMNQRKPPNAVGKNSAKPVRRSSASLQLSNPTSPGSASTGGTESRTKLSPLRESRNATSAPESDQELPDESEHEAFSRRTSVIDGNWEVSSNDEEAADVDEASSVSQESENSEEVAEKTESPPPKRRRVKHDPGPKRKSGKTRAQSKTATPGATDRWTYKGGVKGALPPISKIDEMFLDMTTKAWNDLGLQTAVEILVQRKLRVATMCSGTESPLLALQMINTALRSICGKMLEIDHLFSAEIVPFKQAYIERNFKPKIIFRDIRELSTSESGQAFTAYGGLSDIPSGIDILVAGFSCVDFSNQNNKKKRLSDLGESGETLRGILHYARKYRPTIVILENVLNAPWDIIQEIWQGEANSTFDDSSTFWGNDGPYSAAFVKLDSKLYYIPHTRMRGYMICVDRQKLAGAGEVVELWATLMKKFQRPASSSVEDFLLGDDDDRARQAQEEMRRSTQGNDKAPREVDWDICRGRHHDYRSLHSLGMGRPITQWVDGGSCTVPDSWSLIWAKAQVERIWDTFEISFLRNVVRGFDSQYKARVWELSQNIDRFEDMTPFGVTNCIMPSGIPFLTTRGGPITGLEALSLQGLPINQLILTRESQRELQDLAGNAMTSTVVGAAILGALIVGYSALGGESQRCLGGNLDHDSESAEIKATSLRQVPLDLVSHQHTKTTELCAMAARSIRLCQCEGISSMTSRPLRVCEKCYHTACDQCSGCPVHSYVKLSQAKVLSRVLPQQFAKLIKKTLPMRLSITALEEQDLERARRSTKQKPSAADWEIYSDAVILALKEVLCYRSATRSHCWTIRYDAPHSYLELKLLDGQAQWLLYAKPQRKETADSRARQILKHPFARMHVYGPNILEGAWMLCMPIILSFDVEISGQGTLTRSWESKLGLEDPKFADKQVPTSLHVSFGPAAANCVDFDISGNYELLQDCGTASGSLHKKIGSAAPDLYLFLDPDRIGNPLDDQFVFSTEKHRLRHDEVRYTIARLASSWRPTDTLETQNTSCTVHGQWEHCKAVLSAVGCERPPVISVPYENTVLSMGSPITVSGTHGVCDGSYNSILSCKVPLRAKETVKWPQGKWSVRMEATEDRILSNFAWLTERTRDLGGFTDSWRELALPPYLHEKCCSCAPDRPDIKWRLEKAAIKAYEDSREAGIYERAMKSRPAPFLLSAGVDEQRVGCLSIGLNVTTLAHRALARLSDSRSYADTEVSWRLDTQYEPYPAPLLPRFTLGNNKHDPEAHYSFPKNAGGAGQKASERGPELRTEQKRSLKWMIEQEDDKTRPFYEEEIEEATLPPFGWRAEVRARRSVLVHGGILADEVGYGKTATTLALIDSQSSKAKRSAETVRQGCISIKATLIMVPKTLIGQWKRQISKFLGQKYKVLVLDDMKTFVKQTVGDFEAADIIIASWMLFSNDTYLRKVSDLAALPEPSATDGRAFNAWLAKAVQRIAHHTEELKSASPKNFAPKLQARSAEAWNDETLNRCVPSKRLRGSVYAAAQEKKTGTKTVSSLTNRKRKHGDMDASHQVLQDKTVTDNITPRWTDTFRLKDAKDLKHVMSPVFQMFHFHRVVIDEFTYVDRKNYAAAKALRASSRWVLSGTPPLDDFADIKTIAGFLGISLGVDDDTSGILKGINVKAIRKDRTSAEQFQAFNSVHTLAWHQRRHEHAQRFLDKFARQNTPEIGDIPFTETLKASRLPAAEYAIYMELQQQLQAQDMRIRKGGKAIIDGDRTKRLNELLGTSRSAAEALIKRCSQFTLETDRIGSLDAQNACKIIIRNRKAQYDDLSEELTRVLRHATWLQSVCDGPKPQDPKDEHFGNWTKTVSKAYGDNEATETLTHMIQSAESRHHPKHEDEFYRALKSAAHEKKIAEAVAKELKEQLSKLKAAKSKSKKKTARKSKGKGRTSSSEPSDESIESKASKASRNPWADHRPIKFETDDYAGKVKALRRLVGVLRNLSAELVVRIRAHRFIHNILDMQKWHSAFDGKSLNKDKPRVCFGCRKETKHPTEAFILGTCGHIICHNCLVSPDRGAKCVVLGCDAVVQDCNVLCVSELGSDNSDSDENCQYGKKIEDIVKLLKHHVKKDEQAILFVQFDDLMEKIADALEEQKIGYYALTDKSASTHGKMMDIFQQDVSAAKKKVLLLNPTDQSAAGANLTNPNHVIFVSPLLTLTQHEYDASMTQCIGRARRYGQTNIVQIHRFLSLKTIDVDVLEHRSGRTLCELANKTFVLKDGNSIASESERYRWSSGIDKTKIFGAFQ